jgi:hypothetical protein
VCCAVCDVCVRLQYDYGTSEKFQNFKIQNNFLTVEDDNSSNYCITDYNGEEHFERW